MRSGLEPDSEPAVPVLASRVAARGHRIGEDEEGGPAAASRTELLDEASALAVEHRLEAFLADVVIGWAVQRIAHRHVVRRDRLRDGACRAADVEEPAGDLLAGADFCKRAVPRGIEIDPERLVVRAPRRFCEQSALQRRRGDAGR